MIVGLDFEQMTEGKTIVDDLIRARIFDIVKTESIERFKEDGVFNS